MSDRDTQNKVFRFLGYYWNKPHRTDKWVLLDRYGNRVQSPDALFRDINASPEKYYQEQASARKHAIAALKRMNQENTLILDLETTGTGAPYEEIIEIALLQLDGTIAYHSLVACDAPIHPDAQKKCGITNEMLKDATQFSGIWAVKVSPLIRQKIVVAFNADFDKRIISKEVEHYHLPVPKYYPCDLMRIYMALVTEGRYRLQDACEHYGIVEPEHRGIADAEVTRLLLLKMSEET
jgi:DNA polymerase III epsilon subunit-like protein